MPKMLEKLPDGAEFFFRCHVHSCALKGSPRWQRSNAGWLIEIDGMRCPRYSDESQCGLADDDLEIFYRKGA